MAISQQQPLALGTEKVGKLLRQYSFPAIIAMTAASLYNITDSIFIGHGVGPLAISALAITFPLMNLSAAFGALIGIGSSNLLSIRLGQKNYASANLILGNVLILNVIVGVLFSLITLPFLGPILTFFGASSQTLSHAHNYMMIILLGNVITHLYMGLNSLLRACGNPEKAMYSTIATVIINVILNALFVFGFGWGIRGSATATVISQLILLIWQIKFFSNKSYFIHFKKDTLRLKWRIVIDTISVGSASFFMNAAACFIVILINHGLLKYGGDLAVGAYGIVNRVIFLFAMIVFGVNQGMQPIAGYNFGAQQFDRVTKVLKIAMFWATVIMTTGFVFVELFPDAVASIFTTDTQLRALASNGLRITFACAPIIGIQMVISTFFQSIGYAGKAIVLSLTRQLLFLVPLLLIFPIFFGVDGIWWSLPTSDFIASITAILMISWQFKKFKKMK
ncbi:MAG: MATE family efflux transporter [Bacteroidales bacterium]|jgi:putative MATE family efflux protein|nr:MATE family efflux transporter [Bacteroidales bacterium]